MKYKSMQYNGGRNIIRRRFQIVAGIDYWLSNKDRINDQLTDIKPPKNRHRRSFISCRLPKIVGNKVVYRLFKATRWFKEPNTKCRREERASQDEIY